MKSNKKTANPFKLDIGGRVSNPRNPFPASYTNVCSIPTGLIVPTYQEHVEPKDHLSYKGKLFIRTEPVATCAYTRMKCNTDYYAVPYRLVWKWWDMFYTGVDENVDTYAPSFALNKTPAVPTINAKTLALTINNLYFSNQLDIHGYPVYANALRLLGMLGYIESARSLTRDTSLTSISSTVQYIAADKPMSSDFNFLMQFAATYPTYSFNLFALAAYHCIFYYHYRNVNWDTRNNKNADGTSSVNEPASPSLGAPQSRPWSIDWNLSKLSGSVVYYTSGTYIPSDATASMLTLFAMHYAPYYRDRLTSVVPFVTSDAYSSALQGMDAHYLNGASEVQLGAALDPDDDTEGERPLSAANLRKMFAFDKLQRLKSMTPKTYRAQYESLFGAKGGSCGCTQPFWLGTMKNDIEINPIVATASAANAGTSSTLGQIGGVCTSNGSVNWSKEFDEHCVVLGLSHVIGENDYCADRPNPMNLKIAKTDFYIPQYDALGLQPQFLQEWGLDDYFGVDANNKPKLRDPNQVMGYEPRYSEYKSRRNEIHGEFQFGRSKRNWTTSRNNVMGFGVGYSPSRWYISPKLTDTIFPVVYNGDCKTDPFICQFTHDVVKTSNKALLGVPSF